LLAAENRKRLSGNPSACLEIQAPVWKSKRLSGNSAEVRNSPRLDPHVNRPAI
jgi:hypothetical protein